MNKINFNKVYGYIGKVLCGIAGASVGFIAGGIAVAFLGLAAGVLVGHLLEKLVINLKIS